MLHISLQKLIVQSSKATAVTLIKDNSLISPQSFRFQELRREKLLAFIEQRYGNKKSWNDWNKGLKRMDLAPFFFLFFVSIHFQSSSCFLSFLCEKNSIKYCIQPHFICKLRNEKDRLYICEKQNAKSFWYLCALTIPTETK